MGFREGDDANARAIWLFTRLDLLANIAVIIAAALVAWLKTAWPDLLVAAVIPLLFLQSGWKMIRYAFANDSQRRTRSPHSR